MAPSPPPPKGKPKGKGLGKKVGPFPLWVWLGVGAGVLIVAYLYLRGRDASGYGAVETVTGSNASPEQMAYGGYPSENGSQAGQIDPETLSAIERAEGLYSASYEELRGNIKDIEDALEGYGWSFEDQKITPPYSMDEAVYDATLGPPGGGVGSPGGVIPMTSAVDRSWLAAQVGRGTVKGKQTGGTAIKRGKGPRVPGTPVPGMAGPGVRPAKPKPKPKQTPPRPKPVAKAKPKPKPKAAPKKAKKKVPQRARGAGGGTLRAA